MPVKPFDMGQAMVFFFSRFGDKPGAALWLMFWQILVVFAGLAAFFLLVQDFLGEAFVHIDVHTGEPLDDTLFEAEMLEYMMGLLLWYPLIILGAIMVYAVIKAAWLRFLVRNEIASIIPYRLGGDELRLVGVAAMAVFVAVFGTIAFTFALVFVSLLIAFVTGSGSSAAEVLGVLVSVVFALGGIALVLFVAIRLSNADALSIRDRKFRFFESWTATRGVFWPLLLSYLVVGLVGGFAASLVSTFVQIGVIGAILPTLEQLQDVNIDGMTGEMLLDMLSNILLSPGILIPMIVGTILSIAIQILLEAALMGVAAYNVVRLGGGDLGEAEDAPVLDGSHPAGASPTLG